MVMFLIAFNLQKSLLIFSSRKALKLNLLNNKHFFLDLFDQLKTTQHFHTIECCSINRINEYFYYRLFVHKYERRISY